MDNLSDGSVADGQTRLFHSVFLHLLTCQIFSGYMKFLILRITADLDDFHTVQQGPGDGLRGVGRGDEQHLGQINGDLHIVIPESHVLLSVQDLQKG